LKFILCHTTAMPLTLNDLHELHQAYKVKTGLHEAEHYEKFGSHIDDVAEKETSSNPKTQAMTSKIHHLQYLLKKKEDQNQNWGWKLFTMVLILLICSCVAVIVYLTQRLKGM
jgi:hypothetical protein